MRMRGVAVKWCGRIVKVYTVNLHSRPKSGATLNGLAAVPGVGTAPTYDPPHRCSPTSPHDSRPEREREHKLQHQSIMSPSVGAVGKTPLACMRHRMRRGEGQGPDRFFFGY